MLVFLNCLGDTVLEFVLEGCLQGICVQFVVDHHRLAQPWRLRRFTRLLLVLDVFLNAIFKVLFHLNLRQ